MPLHPLEQLAYNRTRSAHKGLTQLTCPRQKGCASLPAIGEVPAGFGSSFLFLILGGLIDEVEGRGIVLKPSPAVVASSSSSSSQSNNVIAPTSSATNINNNSNSSTSKNNDNLDDSNAFFNPMPEIDSLPVQDETSVDSELERVEIELQADSDTVEEAPQ